MHVNGALLQTLPHFSDGVPTTQEIRGDKTDERIRFQIRAMQKITSQSAHAAKNCRRQLRFPLVDVLVNVVGLFEKFDIARDNFRPGQITPAPEFRRGGTGQTRDGRRIALALNGDFLAFAFRKRRVISRGSPLFLPAACNEYWRLFRMRFESRS